VMPCARRSSRSGDASTRTLVNGVAVSADGKTMEVAQSGVNAKGQTVKNTLVFDRQK